MSCASVILIATITYILSKVAVPMLISFQNEWSRSRCIAGLFASFQNSTDNLQQRVLVDAPNDDGAGSHSSPFGGISSLDIMSASIAVIIIVGAVQCIEYLFQRLYLITHDTPFNQMVQSIEKELMVVGFTAFVFKIVVNTTSFLDLEWFHSLEYAGRALLYSISLYERYQSVRIYDSNLSSFPPTFVEQILWCRFSRSRSAGWA